MEQYSNRLENSSPLLVQEGDRPVCMVKRPPGPVNQQCNEPGIEAKVADDLTAVKGYVNTESHSPSQSSEVILWTNEYLKQEQNKDPDIRPVVQWLLAGSRPDWKDILQAGRDNKNYWMQWESLVLKNGIVYRNFVRPDGTIQYRQLLTPRSLRKEVIHMVHAGAAGHLGVRKTREQVQKKAYWTDWRTDVELYCRCCAPCNQYHRGAVPRQGRLQRMHVGWPCERWQVDLTSPHVPARGLRYIMTAEDAFTKFVVAVPIRDKCAITVARAFIDHVVSDCLFVVGMDSGGPEMVVHTPAGASRSAPTGVKVTPLAV